MDAGSVGEDVFRGTINRFGAIDIRATKVGEDSSLQKLIRMVQEAEDKKSPMARIADKAASWLVPVALLVELAEVRAYLLIVIGIVFIEAFIWQSRMEFPFPPVKRVIEMAGQLSSGVLFQKIIDQPQHIEEITDCISVGCNGKLICIPDLGFTIPGKTIHS